MGEARPQRPPDESVLGPCDRGDARAAADKYGAPLALLLAFATAACADDPVPEVPPPAPPRPYDWGLPLGFPRPRVPAENPMTAAKVELGRHLFYDPRLSGNGAQSCASCHRQELAFTDGRATGLGSTGEAHVRGAMSLVNVGYLNAFTWANPVLESLEEQALVPMFGEAPVELGLAGREAELLARLHAEPRYAELFAAAFPEEADPVTVDGVVRGIAAFERSILSYRTPYDRAVYGDGTPLPEAAERGRELFFGERLECFHCHGGFNLSDSVSNENSFFTEIQFHNTGLYNLDDAGAYPPDNQGIFTFTGTPSDMGRFRAPTLRNVALTAPYMHDGSIATLDEVVDHYAAGGRTVADGPYAGVGADNPYKSDFVLGFELTPEERADLLAFLENLTDEALLVDPRYADPWAE